MTFTTSFTKHVILRSATHLHLDFYGSNCLLLAKRHLSLQCLWEGGSVSNKLLSKHGKTKCHHFCCPCSAPLRPTPSCSWPLSTDPYLVPFSLPLWGSTWLHRAALHLGSGRTTLSSRTWAEAGAARADPEPSEVVSPGGLLFLTNLVVSAPGCGITAVEMQDVKLSWEWLRRSFHRIIESVLFMPFKSCFLLGCSSASSLLLLFPQPLIKQTSQVNQGIFCAIKADPVILLILQIC